MWADQWIAVKGFLKEVAPKERLGRRLISLA
jgi:hypothetical protein